MEQARPEATESVCPVCLRKIPAQRVLQGDEVFQVKECREHGPFKTLIWRGEPALAGWRRPKSPVHPEIRYGRVEKGCPYDCGLCSAHEQVPCSVLLEVTERCNLQCAVCFADAGPKETADPSLAELSRRLARALPAAGPCNLQLSGGEPTLRDDLQEIVATARRTGFPFVQLNTNGLRLAADAGYAKRLQEAGLASVFLQFDGVDDAIYRTLRGRELLAQKLRAVRHAGEAGLGVVLVPTLVPGVNTGAIGAIVRQALDLAPVVRGIHFQPVSYFGRFSEPARAGERFTLPELMRSLEAQTGGLLKLADFSPPGGEHAHCSFHASYLYSADGQLRPLGGTDSGDCCAGDCGNDGIAATVASVARRWRLPPTAFMADAGNCPQPMRAEGPLDLDVFLREAASRTFTLSAMAFQDADNLDLERLRGCCISVISPAGNLVPFCAYNLTSRAGRSLYRGQGSGIPPEERRAP